MHNNIKLSRKGAALVHCMVQTDDPNMMDIGISTDDPGWRRTCFDLNEICFALENDDGHAQIHFTSGDFILSDIDYNDLIIMMNAFKYGFEPESEAETTPLQ